MSVDVGKQSYHVLCGDCLCFGCSAAHVELDVCQLFERYSINFVSVESFQGGGGGGGGGGIQQKDDRGPIWPIPDSRPIRLGLLSGFSVDLARVALRTSRYLGTSSHQLGLHTKRQTPLDHSATRTPCYSYDLNRISPDAMFLILCDLSPSVLS